MKLDLKRVVYFGYFKILEQSKLGDFTKVASTVSTNFASTFPPITGSVKFEKVKDLPFAGDINKLQLRQLAETIMPEIANAALQLETSSEPVQGRWCLWSGGAAHAIRGHDDFRGSQSSAPRIALWVCEMPNEDETVTLVVLHGTADGNMQGLETAELPQDRSGSGTERIFEHLWSQNRGLNIDDFSPTNYSPSHIAKLCIWMIGVRDEWRQVSLESLFRVHYDEFIGDGERQISPLATLDGDLRPQFVSRIIIGSPILVQTPSHPQGKTSGSSRCPLAWFTSS